MQKKVSLFFIFLFIVAIAACANTQNSSKEEAIFTVEHLPDFKERIQYVSFEAKGFALPATRPTVYQAEPELKTGGNFFVHIVVYKTTDNSFKMVFLNDDRPVGVVATKEFM